MGLCGDQGKHLTSQRSRRSGPEGEHNGENEQAEKEEEMTAARRGECCVFDGEREATTLNDFYDAEAGSSPIIFELIKSQRSGFSRVESGSWESSVLC